MRVKPLHKDCWSCKHSVTHSTGSQIWLSCKFQDGWRDVNAVCNLEELELFKDEG
jgi:hypothetical protein